MVQREETGFMLYCTFLVWHKSPSLLFMVAIYMKIITLKRLRIDQLRERKKRTFR